MILRTLRYSIIITIATISLSSYIFKKLINDPKELILIQEFIYNEAPFPSCHASTIVETPEGLVAAWFGGTHEKNKDVEIWLSRNMNGKWTKPVSVANGIQHEDKRYPTWNPVLFQVPHGPLYLYFKVGPDPQEWWGMVTTSNDHGKSWSKPVRLPEDVIGPVKNKPEILDDGRIISPSSTEHDGWKVHFEISKDSGNTWKIVHLKGTENLNVIQPSILKYGDGKLQMLARSKEGYLVSSWSADKGESWEKPKQISLPNPNSGTDAVTLSNGLQLLVYNHSEKSKELWGGKRSPLNVAVSKDGKIWKSVIALENEPGEFSYPAVIQSKDGIVHITYTWHREKIKYVALDLKKLNFDTLNEIKDGEWID